MFDVYYHCKTREFPILCEFPRSFLSRHNAANRPFKCLFKEIIIQFSNFSLHPLILSAVTEEGYETPTPIQLQAIPPVMRGKDLLGIAQTGTGKTAAFALPILHLLAQKPDGRRPGTTRVLVLVPTRELAVQVRESFDRYGRNLKLHTYCVFGGVPEKPQKAAMARGLDVCVATPGRLIDLIGQKALTLDKLGILVLDEADHMLDMGFFRDIQRIVALLPVNRQNLFFSATMPSDIAKLASAILRSPIRVEVTPSATPIELITQHLYYANRREKILLLKVLLKDEAISRALVFMKTKHSANRVCDELTAANISAAAIHGNKSQNRRQEALAGFQQGSIRVLVATDIAARGIDVDNVSHVFNFDLPNVPETYVHRIGRTARAGASGVAISFCSVEERSDLAAIERLIHRSIPRSDTTAVLKEAGITAADFIDKDVHHRAPVQQKPKFAYDKQWRGHAKKAEGSRPASRPHFDRKNSERPPHGSPHARPTGATNRPHPLDNQQSGMSGTGDTHSPASTSSSRPQWQNRPPRQDRRDGALMTDRPQGDRQHHSRSPENQGRPRRFGNPHPREQRSEDSSRPRQHHSHSPANHGRSGRFDKLPDESQSTRPAPKKKYFINKSAGFHRD